MSNMKRQIATLDAQGVAPAEIAQELGVTPGYISQIAKDDDYQSMLAKIHSRQGLIKQDQYTTIDNNYDELEEYVSGVLAENKDVITAAFIAKPALLVKWVNTLNGLKRRSTGEGATAAIQSTAVILQMPEFVRKQANQQVQHNSQNEIIEVDHTPLVAMTANTLANTADEHSKAAMTKLLEVTTDPPDELPDRLQL